MKKYVVAILVFGLAIRLAALDRIPGINGDEAWFGVNVEERIAHRPAFTRTPSGLPINPFHTVPLQVIARFSEPSLLALRLPAAFWNVLALLLAYPLLAVPYGRRAAFLTTLFLAVSPAAIAYSRIGWEPSETVFFSLLGVGLAARGRATEALITFAASLLAHPTNAFLLPVLAGAYWGSEQRSWPKVLSLGPLIAAAVLLAVALPLGTHVFSEGPGVARGVPLPSVSEMLTRIIDPREWLATIRGVLRLVTGTTTSEYIAGPLPDRLVGAIEAIGAALSVVLVALASFALRRRSPRSYFAFAVGLAISLVLFHVVAGSRALAPHHERYALIFIVPACVLVAGLLDAIAASRPRIAFVLCAGWTALFLATLWVGMIVPFRRDGGNSHVTFRTGPVEPKMAAFTFLRSELNSEEAAIVFADSWWSYWPLRYLASRQSDRIQVESMGFRGPALFPPGAPERASPRPARAFAVVFADSSLMPIPTGARVVSMASDPRARPILSVLELDRSR